MASRAISLAVVVVALFVAACSGKGEDRPGTVEVIGGEGSVSVSGAVEGYGEALYFPATDQALNLAIGADLRDMRALMSAAARGDAVDWAEVTAIYERGKNQRRPDGTTRTLATVAAAIPGVHQGIADGVIRAGLTGTGRGAGRSDNARRQLVDKGIQVLMFGLAMERLSEAEASFGRGDATASETVDEAWAIISGARDETTGSPNSGLLATGLAREEDFGFQGRLSRPLESALLATRAAIERKDQIAFQRELDASRGYLGTIMYLSVLRYSTVLEGDQRASDREFHLAEGWAFFQGVKPYLESLAPSAVNAVEFAYTRSPEEEYPRQQSVHVYGAMNTTALVATMGIPEEFRVVEAP